MRRRPAIVALAQCLKCLGNWREAQDIFQTYLKEHPDDAPVRLELADMLVNLSSDSFRNAALNQCEQVLAAKSADLPVKRRARLMRINSLCGLQRYDEALR